MSGQVSAVKVDNLVMVDNSGWNEHCEKWDREKCKDLVGKKIDEIAKDAASAGKTALRAGINQASTAVATAIKASIPENGCLTHRCVDVTAEHAANACADASEPAVDKCMIATADLTKGGANRMIDKIFCVLQ